MKIKVCSKCSEVKSIDEFHKCKAHKDGHKSECKECTKIRTKNYYNKNSELCKDRNRKWIRNNKDKWDSINKNYRINNKEKCSLATKKWQEENPVKVKEINILNHTKNKDKEAEQHKIWAENNPDKIRKYSNDRYYRNKDKMDAKINKNISKHMWESLKGNKNGRHWELLVGYTLEQLMINLEKKFTKGMNWNNYGAWHIDHIIPISLWKFTSYEDREFKQCWSLANLQPLWAFDNLSKGNKI